jgi:hypothetical protein
MFLPFGCVVASFFVLYFFKVLFFLLLLGSEGLELGYVVFLVLELFLFSGDFLFNQIATFFLLQVFIVQDFGLLFLLYSFLDLLELHKQFLFFLKLFLRLLQFDFS